MHARELLKMGEVEFAERLQAVQGYLDEAHEVDQRKKLLDIRAAAELITLKESGVWKKRWNVQDGFAQEAARRLKRNGQFQSHRWVWELVNGLQEVRDLHSEFAKWLESGDPYEGAYPSLLSAVETVKLARLGNWQRETKEQATEERREQVGSVRAPEDYQWVVDRSEELYLERLKVNAVRPSTTLLAERTDLARETGKVETKGRPVQPEARAEFGRLPVPVIGQVNTAAKKALRGLHGEAQLQRTSKDDVVENLALFTEQVVEAFDQAVGPDDSNELLKALLSGWHLPGDAGDAA